LHKNASFDELIPIGVDELIPIGVDELIPMDVSDLFSRPDFVNDKHDDLNSPPTMTQITQKITEKINCDPNETICPKQDE
jgi:hypothetical protein